MASVINGGGEISQQGLRGCEAKCNRCWDPHSLRPSRSQMWIVHGRCSFSMPKQRLLQNLLMVQLLTWNGPAYTLTHTTPFSHSPQVRVLQPPPWNRELNDVELSTLLIFAPGMLILVFFGNTTLDLDLVFSELVSSSCFGFLKTSVPHSSTVPIWEPGDYGTDLPWELGFQVSILIPSILTWKYNLVGKAKNKKNSNS